MNALTWKYVKPLLDEASVAEFETLTGIRLPEDLRAEIRAHNGGRPSKKFYDLPTEKDKEFKSLLSFNRSDVENVFAFYPLDSANRELVPFATDPAGNCFVLKDGAVHLWLHEEDRTVLLADTFADFLAKLHD